MFFDSLLIMLPFATLLHNCLHNSGWKFTAHLEVYLGFRSKRLWWEKETKMSQSQMCRIWNIFSSVLTSKTGVTGFSEKGSWAWVGGEKFHLSQAGHQVQIVSRRPPLVPTFLKFGAHPRSWSQIFPMSYYWRLRPLRHHEGPCLGSGCPRGGLISWCIAQSGIKNVNILQHHIRCFTRPGGLLSTVFTRGSHFFSTQRLANIFVGKLKWRQV